MIPTATSAPPSSAKRNGESFSAAMERVEAAEVEEVECGCCGLVEECTPAYIAGVRERFRGRWVCGLCAEAVADEIGRERRRLIGVEEALARHASFCRQFRASPSPSPEDSAGHFIAAVKLVLRRSLDSPRSESCRSVHGVEL